MPSNMASQRRVCRPESSGQDRSRPAVCTEFSCGLPRQTSHKTTQSDCERTINLYSTLPLPTGPHVSANRLRSLKDPRTDLHIPERDRPLPRPRLLDTHVLIQYPSGACMRTCDYSERLATVDSCFRGRRAACACVGCRDLQIAHKHFN